jgi:uncharacterized protein (DUF952 family)
MTPMGAATIYKLLTRAEWEAAQEDGVYRGSAHDKRDGFIHFSTAAQLGETARKYFSGVPDLVLLAMDVKALESPPSSCPSPAISPRRGCHQDSPYPQADMATLHGKLAKASLRGEGWGEGVSPLRFEPSRGGDLFPHLYAPLPLSAVKSVISIPLAGDGTPMIPCELEP